MRVVLPSPDSPTTIRVKCPPLLATVHVTQRVELDRVERGKSRDDEMK